MIREVEGLGAWLGVADARSWTDEGVRPYVGCDGRVTINNPV